MDLSALLFPDLQPEPTPDGPRRAARAMTIGESDTSSRSGIQADLRAFAAVGVLGLTALTAVRAANTRRSVAAELPEEVVRAQLTTLLSDLPPDALKVGYPAGERAAKVIAEHLEDASDLPPILVDPDLVDPAATPRLSFPARAVLVTRIMSRALVVVLNTDEAALLAGHPVNDRGSMKEAARRLLGHGWRNLLITGGRLEDHALDLLFDGQGCLEFGHDRLSLPADTRGAGHALSAALTAFIARGLPLPEATDAAKQLITDALQRATPLSPASHVVDPMTPRYHTLKIDPLVHEA